MEKLVPAMEPCSEESKWEKHWCEGSGLKSFSLVTRLAHLGLPPPQHRATRDVEDLLKVLEKLKKGEKSLEELLLEFFSSPKAPADIGKPIKSRNENVTQVQEQQENTFVLLKIKKTTQSLLFVEEESCLLKVRTS
jgi:hypothetical protein